MKWMQVRKLAVASTVGLMLLTAGCGKEEPPALPPVPPVPQQPGFPQYGGFGACGAVSGVPLNPQNQPYTALLSPSQVGDNSLSVVLSQTQPGFQFPVAETQLVGSGTFNFGDMPLVIPTGGLQQPPVTSFCVSSASIQGGQPTAGRLYPSGHLYLRMQGLAQIPGPSYGYGPAAPQQVPVTVTIGGSAGQPCAQIYGQTIKGCVDVVIGVPSQPIFSYQYWAQ